MNDRRTKLTKEIMCKALETSNPLCWFIKGKSIIVNNRMQTDYKYTLSENAGENFDENFTPKYTPGEMLKMGVFEGKYCNDQIGEFPQEWYLDALDNLSPEGADVKCNYFSGYKSRQSLQVWQEKKWVPCADDDKDLRGWFEWYMRYWIGRRIPHIDQIQISRWKKFKRHYVQIKKAPFNKRQRQRQACLQWAWPIR